MEINCCEYKKRIEELERLVELLLKEREQRLNKEGVERQLRILQSERIARGFNPSRLDLERGYD